MRKSGTIVENELENFVNEQRVVHGGRVGQQSVGGEMVVGTKNELMSVGGMHGGSQLRLDRDGSPRARRR